MTKKKLQELFKDKNLLEQSLTHRSWVNENKGKRKTNERLEFLGDAILEFVVSEKIYVKFKSKEEGFLTALRANMVNTVNLAKVAKRLEIGSLLLLSKGEEDGGGRENNSLLADTVEAIIGAIFMDQGMGAAKKFIEDNILIDLDEIVKKPLKDAKSTLQEKIQAMGLPTPKYKVLNQKGPDHNRFFTVEVSANSKALAVGTGKSKSLGAQAAAKKALAGLEKKPKER